MEESRSKEEDLSERLVLNVGGRRFETYASTLSAFPRTLLGAMFSSRNRHMRHPDALGEYFFDRDPDCFATVLNLYRTGRYLPPPNVNEELMREEFEYFQMPFMDSRVYSWGRGEYGQLGHGDRCSVAVPTVIDTFEHVEGGIKQISLGTSHSAGLTTTGDVYTWGYGGDGRLGHGSEDDELTPRLLEPLCDKNVEMIVCGELHTAALTAGGEVYSWGLGKNGRLGHSDSETRLTPLRIESLRNVIITQIACGGLHTSALSNVGDVYTWGRGKDGRLGHGDEIDQLQPTLLTYFQQINVTVGQVLCGGHHSAALSTDGQVFTWGFDDDGRLGHGSPGHQLLPKPVHALTDVIVVEIACGCWHSAALSKSGAVFTWGSCKSGQLGQAHKNSVPAPKVMFHGKGGGVVKVACGTAHTAALCANGDLYTWGKHEHGRLGYKALADQATPKLVTALRGIKLRDITCGVYDTAVITEAL